MSRWAGTCQLIEEVKRRDPRGVVETSQVAREVPCNVFSLSQAAYYAASAAGIRPQAVIEIRTCAYRGETLVKFDGVLLSVERAERAPDTVRLTLVERVSNRE